MNKLYSTLILLFSFLTDNSLFAQITASFTSDISSGCAPVNVNFTNTTVGAISKAWNFGNGSSAGNVENPSTTYYAPGTYLVTLYASDSSGSDTATMTISVFEKPTAGFTLTSQAMDCTPPLVVSFQDTSIGGSGTPIVSWMWSFGDGSSSFSQNPTHTYTLMGTFDVSLIVNDANGCSKSVTMDNAVMLGKYLINQQTSICNGDSIFLQGNFQTSAGTFYDTLISVDGCDSIIATMLTISPYISIFQSLDTLKAVNSSASYQWLDCSDNTLISGETNQSFIPTQNGSFAVVITENTCTDTSSCYNVNWIGSCNAYFTLYPDTIPQHWFVLNLATGVSPMNYYWNWGDGNSSIGETPSHIYSDSGFYNICLTIEDSSGCINSYCDSSTYINKKGNAIITVDVILQSTAISETTQTNYPIKIIPNPSNGKFRLQADNLLSANIKICNLFGDIILESKNWTSEIDLSKYPKGIYFIEINTQDKFYSKKLIIE